MGQAFLYGTGGGGTGGTLTVTAPAGVTVTISKDGKVKTKVADSSGVATFKGLKSGTWTVTITSETEEATDTVEIVADYAVTMDFYVPPVILFSTTEEYSGSFTAAAWARSGTSATKKAPTLAVNTSNVKITQASANMVIGTVYNNTPIDLTKRKTLRFTAIRSTAASNASVRAGIIDKLEDGYEFIASASLTGTASTEYTVDVSELKQTGYFAVMVYNQNVAHNVQLTDIRVE